MTKQIVVNLVVKDVVVAIIRVYMVKVVDEATEEETTVGANYCAKIVVN